MLTNILALRGRRIDDVMVPRADIIAVQRDISLGELIKVFEGAGHSRLVVYNETLDDPVGMVHIRDVIGYMVRHAAVSARPRPSARSRSRPASISRRSISRSRCRPTKIIREVLFVPPSMPAIDLLAKMQATRIHLALVIDEYGGTDGIVSIEDIVEQIVGDIEDEHDEDEAPAVVRQPDGSFLADARAPLEDVVATVGPEFEVSEVTERGRYARRLHHDAGRAAAGARRGGAGSGRLRDRGARRRSAPPEAGAHHAPQRAAPGGANVRAGDAHRCGRRPDRSERHPTRDRRERGAPRGSRASRMRWCSPGAGGAPRSRSLRARCRCWRSRRSMPGRCCS